MIPTHVKNELKARKAKGFEEFAERAEKSGKKIISSSKTRIVEGDVDPKKIARENSQAFLEENGMSHLFNKQDN